MDEPEPKDRAPSPSKPEVFAPRPTLAARATAAAREQWRDALLALRDPRAWAHVIAIATVVGLPIIVMAPWLRDMSTYGFHDWDSQTSHRYLVKKTLLEYHQFPGWNPYACGGFAEWGYVESGTIVVSPWLPFYLLDDMRLALRIEVLGMALFGAFGAFMAAGRFTKSPAARALVVVLFSVNGRWGLQTAAGHTWHLAYALLPWCFYAFEVAREAPRMRRLMWLSVLFSLLIYTGAIYPLPHTLLVLGLWALGVAIVERSLRPLLTFAASGVLALGLAAPKLLPMLVTFHKEPREIASDEQLGVGPFFTLLTSHDQSFGSRPASVSPYGWHEWGMYIGVPGVILLGLALLLVTGRREAILKLIAVLLGILGFGAFHPYAPWTLLHAHVPVFRSQHVPSRFLYPAVFVAALVLASGVGRFLKRQEARRPWLEVLLAALVLAMGVDIALVAELPMKDAMWMVAPDDIPRNKPFSFSTEPPYQYKKRDWVGPTYLAMIGNTGVLNCYGTTLFRGRGALARTDTRYRGEVYVDDGSPAAIEKWSPNQVTISVDGAGPGARLVYNMNFDEGWHASVVSEAGSSEIEPIADHDRLSVVLPPGRSVVTFAYTPPRLYLGLVCFLITSAVIGFALWREKRRA